MVLKDIVLGKQLVKELKYQKKILKKLLIR
nr:MAG TPA: hypothetical protein [Caudoviricetes sp.]